MANPPTQIGTSISDLPTVQRFDAGDYKEAPTWFVQKFLQTMNLFTQSVYNVLNQGIDIMQNTREEIYKFTFSCQSGTGSSNTYSFAPKKFVGIPNGVELGQCFNTTAVVPTAIGNPVTFDWYFSGGQVKILAIYGLTSGQTYSFVLRIY